MAVPVAATAGAGAETAGTSLTPGYPASIAAGDVLVLHTTIRDTEYVANTPAGWTAIGTAQLIINQTSQLFYKVASGSESGTLTVTLTGNNNMAAARMYRFTGVDTSGTPYEGLNPETSYGFPVPDAGVTTTSADRLAVNFYSYGFGLTVGAATGQTGGTWAEAFAEYSDAGALLTLQVQTANMASAGTINGGTVDIGSSERTAVVFGLALVPTAGGGGGIQQKLAPSADSVDGTWTTDTGGTTLYDALNEDTASDTDYVKSVAEPSNEGFRVKLASGSDPSISTGHVIHWRARMDSPGGSITVKLYQGGGNVLDAGTLIATFAHEVVDDTTWTTYDEQLSTSQADTISDYGDLYLQFHATMASSGTVYEVPGAIDNTGATDVTADLQDWIDGVPDGTAGSPNTLRFTGGVYKINTGLVLADRNHLVIESSSPVLGGNTELRWGITMTYVAPNWTSTNGQQRFLLAEDSTDITIRYLYLHGPSPMPGSGDGHVPWQTYVQWMHGIEMRRTTGFLVDYVRIDDMPGDGVCLATNGNFSPRSSGTISNCDIHEVHRNGVSLIGSDGCTITANTIGLIGFVGIDLEPNEQASSNYDTLISGNTFASQGSITSRAAISAFSGMISGGAADCDDLTIDGNTFDGRTFEMRFNRSEGYPYDDRIQRLTVTDNVGDPSNPWYPVECRQIDTLNASNNSFTMISGTEFELWDCTNYTITDTYTVM